MSTERVQYIIMLISVKYPLLLCKECDVLMCWCRWPVSSADDQRRLVCLQRVSDGWGGERIEGGGGGVESGAGRAHHHHHRHAGQREQHHQRRRPGDVTADNRHHYHHRGGDERRHHGSGGDRRGRHRRIRSVLCLSLAPLNFWLDMCKCKLRQFQGYCYVLHVRVIARWNIMCTYSMHWYIMNFAKYMRNLFDSTPHVTTSTCTFRTYLC